MVTNQIMPLQVLTDIQKQLILIHPDHFEQFVVAVLSWYQSESPNTLPFFSEEENTSQIPNLFNMFEYPTQQTETVIKLFLDSDRKFLQENYSMTTEEAWNIAVDTFNVAGIGFVERMRKDICFILDGYHLFYYYQDDALSRPRFYNSFVQEVW